MVEVLLLYDFVDPRVGAIRRRVIVIMRLGVANVRVLGDAIN